MSPQLVNLLNLFHGQFRQKSMKTDRNEVPMDVGGVVLQCLLNAWNKQDTTVASWVTVLYGDGNQRPESDVLWHVFYVELNTTFGEIEFK